MILQSLQEWHVSVVGTSTYSLIKMRLFVCYVQIGKIGYIKCFRIAILKAHKRNNDTIVAKYVLCKVKTYMYKHVL